MNLHDEEQRLFVVYRNDDGHTVTRRIKGKPQPEGRKLKLSELWMRGHLGGLLRAAPAPQGAPASPETASGRACKLCAGTMIKPESAREPLDTTTEIETPEHIRFRYHLAGPARRALAYLIDGLLRAVVVVVVSVAAFAGFVGGLPRASVGLSLLVLFLLEWWYYVFFETLWSGRTPGKRALSLRVVTEGGHPLRFIDSFLRNILRAADFLPAAYAVGLLVMGRDPRFRRLGDLLAGTIVIAEDRRAVTAPLRIEPPPKPSELRGLPQRLPLTNDELDAIELFLRREGKLSTARRSELAEIAAPVFARRLGVRYEDAARFLGVLYYRAHEHRESEVA